MSEEPQEQRWFVRVGMERLTIVAASKREARLQVEAQGKVVYSVEPAR